MSGVIGFGPFEWDQARAELRKRGRRVRLTGQPLNVLNQLVSHADRVVTRDELRRQLWGAETFVDFEQGLNTAIARLRQGLGDSADSPRFIETVPGKGYRFIAELRVPLQPAAMPESALAMGIDRRTWLAGGLGALIGAAGAWAGLRQPEARVTPRAPRRFAVSVPPAPDLVPSTGFLDLAISPDGRRVVYRASRDGAARLYMRPLDGGEGQFLPGVDLSCPFFSFDGSEIGFHAFDSHSLMRMSVEGGTPTRIAESPDFLAGASWAADGRITLATSDPTVGLMRIAARGGPAEVLTHPEPGEEHVMPEVLPGGRGVLFSVLPAIDSGTSPYLAVLDPATGDVRRLMPGSHPRFAASGHLVALVGRDLVAARFDEHRLRVEGTPAVVLRGVEGTRRVGEYSLSREGTLLVVMEAHTDRRDLVWVDRSGREELVPAAARPYTYPRVAPDGRHIALNTRQTNRGRIFIWDRGRSAETPLEPVSGTSLDIYPVWHRDGEHLAYLSGTEPRRDLRMVAVGSGGPGLPIGSGSSLRAPYFFTASGEELVYAWQGPRDEPGSVALWKTSMARDAEPVRVLDGARNADLSPDGRLIAYQGDDTGRFEVYVRSFPDVNAQYVKVSTDGGIQPVWSPRGRELFYVEPGEPAHLVSVRMGALGEVRPSRPRRVVEWPYFRAELGRTYDVSRPDGDRFLAIRTSRDGTGDPPPPPRVEVVLDWFTELQERPDRG